MERLLKGTTVFAFNTKRQRSLGHREAHVLFDGMIEFRDVHGNVQQLPIPPDLKKEDLVDFLDSEQNQERIRNYIFHLNTTVTFTKSLCEHKQTTMVYPITDPIVRFPNKLQNIVTMFKGHWFDSSVVQIDPRTNTVKRFVSYTTNGSPPLTCSGDIDTTSGTRSHVYTIGGTGDFFICISGYEKKKLKDYADVRPNVMLVMNGEYHCIPVPLDAVRIGDASMCIVAMLRITDHDMLVVQPTVLWTCEGIEVGDCSNSFYQDRVLDTNPLLMRELNCTTTFPEKPREEAKEDTLLKVTKCSLFVEAGLALPTVFQGRTTHIGVIGRGFHVQREDETHTASAGVWFSPFQDVVRGPIALLRRPSAYDPLQCLSDERVSIFVVGTNNPSNMSPVTQLPLDPIVIIVSDKLDVRTVSTRNARLYTGPLCTIFVYSGNRLRFHSGTQRFGQHYDIGDTIDMGTFFEHYDTLKTYARVVNPATWVPLFQEKPVPMQHAEDMVRNMPIAALVVASSHIMTYLSQVAMMLAESPELERFRASMINALHSKTDELRTALRTCIVNVDRHHNTTILDIKRRLTQAKREMKPLVEMVLRVLVGKSTTLAHSLQQAKRNQDIRDNVKACAEMTQRELSERVEADSNGALVFRLSSDYLYVGNHRSFSSTAPVPMLRWDERSPVFDDLTFGALLYQDQNDHKYGLRETATFTMPTDHTRPNGDSWILVPMLINSVDTFVNLVQWVEEANDTSKFVSKVRILLRNNLYKNNAGEHFSSARDVGLTYMLVKLFVGMIDQIIAADPARGPELDERLLSLMYLLLNTLASSKTTFSPLYKLFTDGPVDLVVANKDPEYLAFNNNLFVWLMQRVHRYLPDPVQERLTKQSKKYLAKLYHKCVAIDVIKCIQEKRKKNNTKARQEERFFVAALDTIVRPLEKNLVVSCQYKQYGVAKKVATELRNCTTQRSSWLVNNIVDSVLKYDDKKTQEKDPVNPVLLECWCRRYENPLLSLEHKARDMTPDNVRSTLVTILKQDPYYFQTVTFDELQPLVGGAFFTDEFLKSHTGGKNPMLKRWRPHMLRLLKYVVTNGDASVLQMYGSPLLDLESVAHTMPPDEVRSKLVELLKKDPNLIRNTTWENIQPVIGNVCVEKEFESYLKKNALTKWKPHMTRLLNFIQTGNLSALESRDGVRTEVEQQDGENCLTQLLVNLKHLDKTQLIHRCEKGDPTVLDDIVTATKSHMVPDMLCTLGTVVFGTQENFAVWTMSTMVNMILEC